MNKKIKFSHNWNNKLNNHLFTTIRSYSQEKLDYYVGSIGETFDDLLKGKFYNNVTLINVQAFKFKTIPHGLIMLDTGMSYDSARGLFEDFGIKDDDFAIILTFAKKDDSEVKQ